MNCAFCNAWPFGANEKCWACREYYELTGDWTRQLIDRERAAQPVERGKGESNGE